MSIARAGFKIRVIDTNQSDSAVIAYIKAHPGEVKSLRMLKGLSITCDYPVIEPLYQGLSTHIKNLPAGIKFRRQMENMKSIRIGADMPDFSASDTSGHPITLKQLRGKYVLLDFWAAWCTPCRRLNPELVKIYNQFKEKPFIILGVSLDKERRFWVAAIKKDKLPWLQVSDLKQWNSAIAQLYGVQAIPQNFLISPDGKLVVKNLRSKALEDKLSALLNEL
ncbi:TlpA disulfide reductase family protein [Mucilaginibacter sp. CSA2-8R]|uniref:peroxiredoxin family protein n=1 Tax=Mucilaginibacter sp. CSA2-8R TaxID=3141542 RepID=UPI00315D3293